MEFHQVIWKYYRDQKRISIRGAGQRSGVNWRRIHDYLHGRLLPSRPTLKRLINWLGWRFAVDAAYSLGMLGHVTIEHKEDHIIIRERDSHGCLDSSDHAFDQIRPDDNKTDQ